MSSGGGVDGPGLVRPRTKDPKTKNFYTYVAYHTKDSQIRNQMEKHLFWIRFNFSVAFAGELADHALAVAHLGIRSEVLLLP